MPAPVLTCFPASITAGDTVRIQLTFGDYPVSAWTAALKLNQPSAEVVSVPGVAVGSAFQFVITATISAAMASGVWTWAARVTETSSGDVVTADAGDLTVLADYGDAIEKSIAQQQLDAANAALLKLTARTHASVAFNGQEFTSSNASELVNIIARLEQKVAREQTAAAGLRGDPPTRSIRPYFV